MVIGKPYQARRLGIEIGPANLIQPIYWITDKSCPGSLKQRNRLPLQLRVGDPTDASGVPKDHLEFCTMIGTTAGIQPEIGPITEIAVLPHRDIVGFPTASFERVGARERLQQELVALSLSRVDTTGIRRQDVEALLVLVVPKEIGLG